MGVQGEQETVLLFIMWGWWAPTSFSAVRGGSGKGGSWVDPHHYSPAADVCLSRGRESQHQVLPPQTSNVSGKSVGMKFGQSLEKETRFAALAAASV